MTTVFVCFDKDIECGNNSANWCASCPKRGPQSFCIGGMLLSQPMCVHQRVKMTAAAPMMPPPYIPCIECEIDKRTAALQARIVHLESELAIATDVIMRAFPAGQITQEDIDWATRPSASPINQQPKREDK